MKKIISLFIFSLVFIFASCSLFENFGENETASVSMEISSSLLKEIASRNADSRSGARNGDEKLSFAIEVSLTGDYSEKKTVYVPIAVTPSGGQEFSSAKVTFDAVPVNSKVSAKVVISKLRTEGHFTSKERQLKGYSQTKTIEKGTNTLSLKLKQYFKDYPVTITIGFKDGENLLPNLISVDVYAFKAGSSQIQDFYKHFGTDEGDYKALYAFEETLLEKNEGEGHWSSGNNSLEIDTERKQIIITDEMRLSQDEKLVFIARTGFSLDDTAEIFVPPYGRMEYIGYADVSSLDELNATAITPSVERNEASLKLTKLRQNIYAIFHPVSGKYEIYPTEILDGELNGFVSETNRFTFDSKGGLYVLSKEYGSPDTQFIQSAYGRTNLDLRREDDPYPLKPEFITIDRATDIMYACYLSEGELEIFKLPDFVSKNDASTYEYIQGKDAMGKTINFGTLDYNGSHDKDIIVVNNGIAYGFGCKGERALYNKYMDLPAKFYKFDINQDHPQAEDLGFDYSILGLTDEEASYVYVSDMLYQDGAVYILVKERESDGDDYIISRGAVIKYKDGQFTAKNFAPDKNLTSFKAAVRQGSDPWYKSNNRKDYYTMNFSASYRISTPYNAEKSYFVGPEKFVAIKPKRLVIADAGTAIYTLADGTLAKKKINRVVEIDLESLSMADADITEVTKKFLEEDDYKTEKFSGLKTSVHVASGTAPWVPDPNPGLDNPTGLKEFNGAVGYYNVKPYFVEE